MAVDRTKLSFYSGNNYMKRSEFFGVVSQPVPPGLSFNTTTINHGLGYVPFFTYAVDFNNDGILWTTDYVVSGHYTDPGPALFRCYVDENNLYVRSGQNSDSTGSGPRNVYYGIYLDFNV